MIDVNDIYAALGSSLGEHHDDVFADTLRLTEYRGDIDAYMQEVIATAQGLLDVKLQMTRLEFEVRFPEQARLFHAFLHMQTRGIH